MAVSPAIREALRQGYTIRLLGDGIAHVEKNRNTNTTYHVQDGTCDCPDYLIRGGSIRLDDGRTTCKHALWVSQTCICRTCQGVMLYGEYDGFGLYECQNPKCRDTRDARLVRKESNHDQVSAV